MDILMIREKRLMASNSDEQFNVLVVDDNEDLRDLVKLALEMGEYNCSAAASGQEALQILSETKVDLVITDIMMPGMDGKELTHLIREKHEADVIVISGFAENFTYEEIIRWGASDFMQKPVKIAELLIRVKRVLHERTLVHQRNQMLKELQESEKKFQQLSIVDELTRLYNVRHFQSQLETEVDRANRYGHPLTLLMIDVDNLKKINDTYGHQAGDAVLAMFGRIVHRCLRKTDLAFRYGGDEFVVILPEATADQALVVAERVRQELKNEVFIPKEGMPAAPVTVSIGVAHYREEEDMHAFARRADLKMYSAKKNGKDRVFYCEDELTDSSLSMSIN
jgi:two-component system, cell cycle response regulator